jgi:hypothetical protein
MGVLLDWSYCESCNEFSDFIKWLEDLEWLHNQWPLV